MFKLIKTSMPTVVLFVGFGLVASAAATSPNLNSDVLYGCVTPVHGNLTRVSITPPTCPKNTSLITWGAKGAQGSAGIQGIKGDKGDTGLQGPVGQEGIQGLEGLMGLQGPNGEQGPKGDVGSQGDQGDTGPKGDVGPQGAAGPSDLYVFSGLVEQCRNSAGDVMATMTLPAGSYIVDVFTTYSTQGGNVLPTISAPNQSASLIDLDGNYSYGRAMGNMNVTLAETGAISIKCGNWSRFDSFGLQRFTAQKVGQIHLTQN